MSASDTGDEAPLIQFFNSVRNNDSASSPACLTASSSSAASRVSASASASAKRQSFDAHRRRVDAITELQVVGRSKRFEYLEQMACDRHLAHRISDVAVFNPEAGCAAAVIAGDAIDAGTDQIGDVEPLGDVGDQFLRRYVARLEMKIIRSRRRRGRHAAMGVPGGDQSELPRG